MSSDLHHHPSSREGGGESDTRKLDQPALLTRALYPLHQSLRLRRLARSIQPLQHDKRTACHLLQNTNASRLTDLLSNVLIGTGWEKSCRSERDLHHGLKELIKLKMNSMRVCTRWIVPLSRDVLLRRTEIGVRNCERWRRTGTILGGEISGRWFTSSNGMDPRM